VTHDNASIGATDKRTAVSRPLIHHFAPPLFDCKSLIVYKNNNS
jgi:hypothetical protein